MRPGAVSASLLAAAVASVVALGLSAAADEALGPRPRRAAAVGADPKIAPAAPTPAPGSGPPYDRLPTPWRPDPSCPGGKAKRILDCPEMVCPCGRGLRVVLARAYDPESRCCSRPSCERICGNHCPRFHCPCGVPGDLAAATDEATGECIADQEEVCARACSR